MPGGKFQRASRSRRAKPLVVRGGLARTFGGLASFLAVIFRVSGIYILDDVFANPIAAQAAAVIAAAFSIALATILLFYLLKPGKKFSVAVPHNASRVVLSVKPSIFGEPSKVAREEDSRGTWPISVSTWIAPASRLASPSDVRPEELPENSAPPE